VRGARGPREGLGRSEAGEGCEGLGDVLRPAPEPRGGGMSCAQLLSPQGGRMSYSSGPPVLEAPGWGDVPGGSCPCPCRGLE